MSSEYTYLAKVRRGYTSDAPSGLWRTRDDEMEYLSLIDWEWHPATDGASPPNPITLVEIPQAQAQELLSDRQRFVRYWSYQHPTAKAAPRRRIGSTGAEVALRASWTKSLGLRTSGSTPR